MKEKILRKRFSEDEAIVLFATGTFGASLIVGLFIYYGLDKIF